MTDFQLAPPEKDICKIHTDRSNKHLSRISTSKLSKEELEDLYYEIFESNIELKRLVNQQKQTINALNTKVLRMTATRKSPISSNPCCVDSRVTIREQKEMIQELKLANEKLMEKIRQLKVQLCTKKQFTKTSPNQKTRVRPPLSQTNNLNARNKESETSLIIEVPKEQPREKTSPENLCTENKCVTQMEELKEKINNLEEELNAVQQGYNTRIVTLEEEIGRLSKEEQAARAARVASQAVLTQRQEEAKKLASALRNMETHTNQLSAQLQFEKMKVSDLEMQLKTNRMSNNMFDVIEEYFNNRISKRKKSIENLRPMKGDHSEDTELHHTDKDTAGGGHRVVSPSFRPQRNSAVEESMPMVSKPPFSTSLVANSRSCHGRFLCARWTEVKLRRLKIQEMLGFGLRRLRPALFAAREDNALGLARANAGLCEKVLELQAELDRLKVFVAGQEVASLKTKHYDGLFDDQGKIIVANCADDGYSTKFGFNDTTEEQRSDQIDHDIELEEHTLQTLKKEELDEKSRKSENGHYFISEHIVIQENNIAEYNISNNNTKEEQDADLGGDKNPSKSLPNTYTLKHETIDLKKSSSPENTDYDVSSITDASSAKSPKGFTQYTRSLNTTPRSPTEPLSLGENGEFSSVTGYTLTSTERNTTDRSLGYLSEGEIPSVTGNFMLSCEWAEMKEKYKHENLALVLS
ncbi:hypothetical protein EVAR_75747_1 [Eumeta japonica]|uniref:Uncharacterized protein n=1 Tax=Eumeta variegata TaxID=151549 RepID=A0A4C1TCV9_EUMVA|nr:hypothetical protein EVAR_75747_1 [Eumeta japonica]